MTSVAHGFAFTTAVAAQNDLATKTIEMTAGGLVKSPYPNVSRWMFNRRQVADLGEMSHELAVMSDFPSIMIVRGEPLPHIDLGKPQLRRSNNSKPETNTLKDVPRSWLVVDVDDCAVPTPLGLAENLVEAGVHVRTLLPVEFHDAACIVSASPSTGLSGPALARLRLWFLLDRPIASADLYRWARGARATQHPVDPHVCLPSQPIYVARPQFIRMTDPVPPALTATLIEGSVVRVPLKLDRFEQKLVAIERSIRTETLELGSDWRRFLDRTLGSELGYFEPLKRGLGLAVRQGATVDEAHQVVSDLLARRADPGRQQSYGREWIAKAMAKFSSQDAQRAAADRAVATEIGQRFYRAFNVTAPEAASMSHRELSRSANRAAAEDTRPDATTMNNHSAEADDDAVWAAGTAQTCSDRTGKAPACSDRVMDWVGVNNPYANKTLDELVTAAKGLNPGSENFIEDILRGALSLQESEIRFETLVAAIAKSQVSPGLRVLRAATKRLRAEFDSARMPSPDELQRREAAAVAVAAEDRRKRIEHLATLVRPLAADPDLIKNLIAYANDQGVVGEDAAVVATFLTAVSRTLAGRAGCMVRTGAPSSGKNFVVEAILATLDPARSDDPTASSPLIRLSSSSPLALVYSGGADDEDSLKGRLGLCS